MAKKNNTKKILTIAAVATAAYLLFKEPINKALGISGYNNKFSDLRVMPSGHGHYKIYLTFRGKEYATTTNDMPSIDDFKSDEFEKDGRELRKLRGYKQLRWYVINDHSLR